MRYDDKIHDAVTAALAAAASTLQAQLREQFPDIAEHISCDDLAHMEFAWEGAKNLALAALEDAEEDREFQQPVIRQTSPGATNMPVQDIVTDIAADTLQAAAKALQTKLEAQYPHLAYALPSLDMGAFPEQFAEYIEALITDVVGEAEATYRDGFPWTPCGADWADGAWYICSDLYICCPDEMGTYYVLVRRDVDNEDDYGTEIAHNTDFHALVLRAQSTVDREGAE